MKTILTLTSGTIELHGTEGSGAVQSTFHIKPGDADYEAEYRDRYNAAIDAMESVVLAHFCAGVKVEAPEYIDGLETALVAIDHQMG